jgi:glycosyltransferase involved in cell wall biosynthesis
MKISIIGTVGLPACYGGFETLVENLVDETDKKNDISVYCSSKSYYKKIKKYNEAKLTYIPFKANGPQSIIYDITSLLHALFTRPDVVLILGVSGCIFLPFFRLFSKAKLVTNIDGLEWRREKWGKWPKRFLKYSEKLAVKYSDVVIADNQGIADYVNEEYRVKSAVIAYGGDHAVGTCMVMSDAGFALALCRIEPENNVEMILDAFSHTDKPLKFIGNWANSDFGQQMKAQYSSFDNIDIVDPIYDIEKLSVLRASCSFYVHGHSAGGTNPSLVEMMHFCKPIMCFDCNYNRASTENMASFFSDSDSLVGKINAEKDTANGKSMLEIAQRRYTWDIVRTQYFDVMNSADSSLITDYSEQL